MKKLILMFLATVSVNSVAVAEECSLNEQIEALALNIYHEARGEGIDGMLMVAEVTMNRVFHPAFPDTVCEVVYQPHQFSWTIMSEEFQRPDDIQLLDEALRIAEYTLVHAEEIGMGTNATHYLNPSLLENLPSWTFVYQEVGRVGNHVFYAM